MIDTVLISPEQLSVAYIWQTQHGDAHVVPGTEFTLEDALRQRPLDEPLHRLSHRPSSQQRIKPPRGE